MRNADRERRHFTSVWIDFHENHCGGKNSFRIAELDGLRGFLALWVALSHIFLWCGFWETSLKGPIGSLEHYLVSSPAAVETFYILSGFAISCLLHSRPQSHVGFLVGRFFRIHPVYLACLVLSLTTMVLTPTVLKTATWRNTAYFETLGSVSTSEQAETEVQVLAHVTLLNGLLPKQVLPDSSATLLPPAWSISVERQFYLFAPLIARLALSGWGLLSLTALAWAGVRYGGSWYNPLPVFLPIMLPFFLVGIGSFHIHARFRSLEAKSSARHLVPVFACLGFVLLVAWHRVALTIWVLAFGSLFVASGNWLADALCRLRQCLRHPSLQYFGRVSYPLYLVHWPLITVFLYVLLRYKPTMRYPEAIVWMLLVALPSILCVAHVLHISIEAPCMNFGKRFTSTRRSGGPSVV